MGGETRRPPDRRPDSTGPSPRGRGNPGPTYDAANHRRSIPAWAGKPRPVLPPSTAIKVHPRVGGETRRPPDRSRASRGPSPRGRGNRKEPDSGDFHHRSIPAWAGKPRWRSGRSSRTRVHPRVGGETSPPTASTMRPRGPSPRGRGNLLRRVVTDPLGGSIPAWAGKPYDLLARAAAVKVHPRVGGETFHACSSQRRREGPSPRGRGNLVFDPDTDSYWGSIPAWAGKPRTSARAAGLSRVHPRVGGETMRAAPTGEAVERSIPAWAGKPPARGPGTPPARVHPRVGGETRCAADLDSGPTGPSPRGRGNQARAERRE